ncbi:MAG: SRPBCC domain-containing protein, partial [Candidatus Binataceae bacterium]
YEISPEGVETEIGKVTVYEPPSRVAFTFRAPDWNAATLVDVRFVADGVGTRVELEHSGWEQDAKLEEASKNFDHGWDFVLGKYTTHIAALSLLEGCVERRSR